MFGYLRYFSAISLVIVVLAAFGVGFYFKTVASGDLQDLVQRNSAALSQGYINSAWKKHHDIMLRLFRIPITSWRNYKEFRAFSDDSLLYFEEMPIANITLYTPDTSYILSTMPQRVTGHRNNKLDPEMFKQALQGKPVSKIMKGEEFLKPDGSPTEGTLVLTYVPIIPDYYSPIVADSRVQKVEAVIELYYDVTPQWQKLSSFQMISTGGIVVIFVVLIIVLHLSSRRAEGIIAKQHELNLELTAAAAAAEAENRDKSQFLASISHELRTPLNAIIGFSEIIRVDNANNLSKQHQEYLDDILSSGKHLLSLINDILDYSKAEAGKLEMDISEIDALKMAKNSLRLVIPRAESAQVMLAEDLPSKAVILQTDAKKLKQVLLNLLSNAVKFTPAGGQVKISVWHDMTNDTVSFEVKDSGIGIAAKDISRVMSPFGQVDSSLARKYEGTGLGLPLSKKFVEIMGGSFNIESQVGVGTTVTITFPRNFKKPYTVVRTEGIEAV